VVNAVDAPATLNPMGSRASLAADEAPQPFIADHPQARAVWALLGSVPDPEIPVLSIVDLGIVRAVHIAEDGAPEVTLTPTWSGCPATAAIREAVEEALAGAGYANVSLREALAPPWSSDWLTEAGREKLRAFGIAPPVERVAAPRRLLGSAPVPCPRCGSADTVQVSAFGSTPCKAHWRCRACLEPFDAFKCI
jgi:ring-1,2-phenylacetyl-CoA epoxidase subunit PaaD